MGMMKGYRLFLLCKCMKRVHAEDMFYNGNLFFNYLIKWIKQGEKGDEGQGDACEGVFSDINNDRTKRLRKDAEETTIKGKKYLRSKSIVRNWPCICFYSISELTESEEKDGQLIYNMAKDYVDSFCDGETLETMINKDLQERVAMVVIRDTSKFLKRLRGYFSEQGLKEFTDYIIRPVEYRRKGLPFVIHEVPYELFSKDWRFRKQQELRIALNPNNPKVLELLNGGQKINIGPMEEFASLKTNFYKGAKIKVDVGGKTVTISDAPWVNMFGPLQEWNLSALLGLMEGAYHTTKCVLNKQETDIASFWAELSKVFCWKYGIEMEHREYVDGVDDLVTMYFHRDSFDAILKNEEKDSCYYLRDGIGYKAPSFNALMGGMPPGRVVIEIGKR